MEPTELQRATTGLDVLCGVCGAYWTLADNCGFDDPRWEDECMGLC